MFLKEFINDVFIGISFAITSGIMINISLKELLPESFSYQNKKIIFIGFILGVIIMVLSHFL